MAINEGHSSDVGEAEETCQCEYIKARKLSHSQKPEHIRTTVVVKATRWFC